MKPYSSFKATHSKTADPEATRPKASRIRTLAILGLASVLAMAALAGCGGKSNQSSTSTTTQSGKVPAVVGLTKADASLDITGAGFVVGAVSYQASDTVYFGNVISQNPTSGTSESTGTKVDLVISSGSLTQPKVAVPDLTGMTQTQAEAALANLGLVPKSSEPVQNTAVKPGTVFKQSTAAGTQVVVGATVTFTVALGTQTASIPDVTGMSQDSATKALTDAGFGVDVNQGYSDSVATGNIVSESPSAGTQVATGTKVTLVVSLGAKPAGQVAVPNLMTLTLDEANAALGSAGLKCNPTGDASGTAVAQDIKAGTKVDQGTTVTVTFQAAPTQIAVPDISGMNATDAINTLAGADLFGEIAGGDMSGTVVSQDPAAGTSVDLYSTVSFTLSAGPTPVTTTTVPDLSKMTLPNALNVLRSVSLYGMPTGDGLDGTVVKQNPAAGSKVSVGSTVNFEVENVLLSESTGSTTDASTSTKSTSTTGA